MKKIIAPLALLVGLAACNQAPTPPAETAEQFLAAYNAKYQELLTAASEAEWKANTYIVEGDTLTEQEVTRANKAMADFTGSQENIDKARKFLEDNNLSPLVQKQLRCVLYKAGGAPASAGALIDEKIKAENDQNTKLFAYRFVVDKDTVSANKIDSVLQHSSNLDLRLKYWESSKAVGIGLKDGLANLQRLRNATVKDLGYSDYFSYQVSDYGMTTDEMMQLCHQMTADIWPLYRELHTWARYELAKKYNKPVPDMIPAHWLPNRWGQDWTALMEVDGLDVDKALSTKEPKWIIEQGEEFYKSLGFPALPATFHEKSSLYPAPAGAKWAKNNHASAWHMNNDNDVRSLMSIEPNTRWWGTTLHELGHIYYFMEYSNPEVPIILREGANRGYHEAMGSLLGLAAMQQPFLENRGLLEKGLKIDQTRALMKEALEYAVVIPWGAGVMTGFEHDLYANNLPKDQFNAKWWELVRKYQGIEPPTARGEEFCDAASKTHINNDAAQYYDYAISYILLFQFHDHIAKNILKQDPHATDYWGNKEVGSFLRKVMHPGATVDWREHLRNSVGSDMSAKPMLDYFAPLMDWLKSQNKGRIYTLPETI